MSIWGLSERKDAKLEIQNQNHKYCDKTSHHQKLLRMLYSTTFTSFTS